MSCTLFVIESDRVTREFMQDMLGDEGYVVQCCSWQAATVAMIAEAQSELVVLDFAPHIADTAMLFLDQLRQHPATHHVPVLVTSTSPSLLASLNQPLQFMTCDTMLKPFDIDAFLSRVAQLCAAACRPPKAASPVSVL